MKGLFYAAAFAILASTPVFGADAVSLVGTWAGQRERIAKVEGRRGGLATLVVTEQLCRPVEALQCERRRGRVAVGRFHAGRQVDHGIGRGRDVHLQSRRSEYGRLLLQRDRCFSALRVREAHAAAVTRCERRGTRPSCQVATRPVLALVSVGLSSCKMGSWGSFCRRVRDVGTLRQATAERDVLARRLVERDQEIIRRDSGGRDDPIV